MGRNSLSRQPRRLLTSVPDFISPRDGLTYEGVGLRLICGSSFSAGWRALCTSPGPVLVPPVSTAASLNGTGSVGCPVSHRSKLAHQHPGNEGSFTGESAPGLTSSRSCGHGVLGQFNHCGLHQPPGRYPVSNSTLTGLPSFSFARAY